MPWRCAERFMLECDGDAAARPSTVQAVERQVGILTAEITPISTGNYMVNTCQYKKNLYWHFYRLPPCGFHVSVFACNIYWSTLYIHPQNSVLIFSNITRMKWNCVEIGLMFCGWVVITARILLGWSNTRRTPLDRTRYLPTMLQKVWAVQVYAFGANLTNFICSVNGLQCMLYCCHSILNTEPSQVQSLVLCDAAAANAASMHFCNNSIRTELFETWFYIGPLSILMFLTI